MTVFEGVAPLYQDVDLSRKLIRGFLSGYSRMLLVARGILAFKLETYRRNEICAPLKHGVLTSKLLTIDFFTKPSRLFCCWTSLEECLSITCITRSPQTRT